MQVMLQTLLTQYEAKTDKNGYIDVLLS